MAGSKPQYQHYIPRFILKRFIHTETLTTKQFYDGLLHVHENDGSFHLREVSKTCGALNLYYKANTDNPMQIEILFSKLECKTASIFSKIHTAVTEGDDHIDILEKDIHTLFKFMNLSLRRSEKFKDEFSNPRRENDFLFQRMFDASRKSGGSGEPHEVWLEHLLYLLETDHEGILTDAENREVNHAARTYKYFIDNYALQIWKAADGYEFFLNENLVDFEGDTESRLGTEENCSIRNLIWMTTKDIIHLVLPISPQVAIIFCNEARCWESPFAESMHRSKIPYPQNSLLKNAPHKDIVDIEVPSQKRGRKTWAATVAWRVSIGKLSREHHRIIAAYSLGHAEEFIVMQRRARFERAKRELEEFNKERAEAWTTQGVRFEVAGNKRESNHGAESASPSKEGMDRHADMQFSALQEIIAMISTGEAVKITKKNIFKCWAAARALGILYPETMPNSGTVPPKMDTCMMHPALKKAFEASYPLKPSEHRNLRTIDFGQFLDEGMGEELFATLMGNIDSKISELTHSDDFSTHWKDSEDDPHPFRKSRKSDHEKDGQQATSSGVEERHSTEEEISPGVQPAPPQEKTLNNAAFKSVFRYATGLDTLRWMFEERQDILATFVSEIGVPMEDLQPEVIRIRARRE